MTETTNTFDGSERRRKDKESHATGKISDGHQVKRSSNILYKCLKCETYRTRRSEDDHHGGTGRKEDKRGRKELKKRYGRIGKRLKEKAGKTREYEIVKDDEGVSGEFIPSVGLGILRREHREARIRKDRLLKRWKGKRLEDAVGGKELSGPYGSCFHIRTKERLELKMIDPEQAKTKILAELTLIYGIGPVRERRLKEKGYDTIDKLIDHPRFGSEAEKCVGMLERTDSLKISERIGRWFPRSHPAALYTSSFRRPEDFVILDIESMGLFGRPIILFGIARVRDDEMIIDQYLLREIREEVAALEALLSHIDENSVFMTYNGRTFDLPYIVERLIYYGNDFDLDRPHFDILHFSRRVWGESAPNCKLTTLEKFLFDIERQGDVPGALVPEFYETYLRTENVGPLVPIIEHNQQDLITLAKIFSKLHEVWG